MNLHNEPGFTLVHGGKPPAKEPELPNPNAPIDLGCGIFHPLHNRLDVALATGTLGAVGAIFTTEELARAIAQAIDGRPIREVFETDFIEARRSLIESGARHCLAGSRAHVGFVALYRAITSDAEAGANWLELASFDARCSGVAAALAGQYASVERDSARRGSKRRYVLWSVPKQRMRLGLHLSAGNKEGTVIKADSIPVELLRDVQILVLSTFAGQQSAAA